MSATHRWVGFAIAGLLLVALGARADPRRATGSIVNGVTTVERPAVGALLWGATPGSAHLLCSGTMIGCGTFLTAGHCVEGFLDPADYFVYLPHAGLFAVASVALHPDYAFPVADVAVLTLAGDVTAIRPVAIDAAGGQSAGTAGTIVGFGEIGGPAGDAGLARAGSVSIDTCIGGISNATSVCWAFEEPVGPAGTDSNTCSGDSGGPLLVAAGADDLVAGITSGGSSADCLAPDLSFDARVSFYASWIAGEGGADLASARCGAGPQIGEPGAAVDAFEGTVSAAAPESRHTVEVPASTAELRVTMNGVEDGSDFDLYVKRDAPPTTSDYDCADLGAGQFASCLFPAPAAGTWHVLVHRFGGSGPYQATATVLAADCTAAEEGLPCDDANACTTGETCQAGTCTGGSAVACDDGIACTVDACHPATGCLHLTDHGACGACETCDPGAGCLVAPRPDCRRTVLPLGAKLKIKDTGASRRLLLWKLPSGGATTLASLGDPTSADDQRLCLYDESGPTAVEVLRADVPAGGTCGTAPCWKVAGTRGFKYTSRDGAPDGVTKLILGAGGAGRSKLLLKAKGADLPALPPTPLALPLRAQLHADDGTCWESTFSADGALRNAGGVFVGRGD